MFHDQIFSQVSSEFVTPIFPKEGEEITISIAFAKELKVDECYLVTNKNGVNNRIVMQKQKKGNTYVATTEAEYLPATLRYYFVFLINKRYYYFSKRKCDVFAPPAKDQFVIKSNLDMPSWIASSTCYQIFPDRFYNGDKSNDVKAGAYSFDGGTVSTPAFTDAPKEFPLSRCLDFYNGDLKGVEEKIAHLKRLGITLVYLNPINSSLTVHRYDSTDYFHVDEKLGGDKALEELIRALHKNGIRVLVDISINHTGSQNPWFLKAKADKESVEASFYVKNSDSSFCYWNGVETLPQLNWRSEELRDRVYRSKDSAMQKYLKEPYGQDGWRLDVAPELGRAGKDRLTYEVWRDVRKSLKAVNKDIYLVGEDWNDASEYLEGDMWDATMNYYGSGRLLRSWMGERDRFLTSSWGHAPEADNEMNAYDAERAFNETASATIDQALYMRMNLIDSHDTPRLHNHKAIYDQDIYEGVIMALYLLPGMPNIYYGDEIELDGTLGSVEGSRYPMCWDEEKWNKRTLSIYEKLGALRKEDPSLAFASSYYQALSPFCLLIIRKCKEHAYLLVLNKSKRDSTYIISTPVLSEYKKVEDLFNRSISEKDGSSLIVSLVKRRSTILLLS